MSAARILSLLDWLAGRPHACETDPPRELAHYAAPLPPRGLPARLVLRYWLSHTLRPYELTDDPIRPPGAECEPWRATFTTDQTALAWLARHGYRPTAALDRNPHAGTGTSARIPTLEDLLR